MLNQRFYRYPSLLIDSLSQYLFIKTYKLNPLFGSIFISFNRGQTKSISNTFLLYLYRFLASYPGSDIMYNTYGKENTEEEEVKGINILLSIILAVVTSAVRGTARTPVVHVRCILYSKTHPSLVLLWPTTLHLYQCQNEVLFFSSYG
jgi:hypothetical protein